MLKMKKIMMKAIIKMMTLVIKVTMTLARTIVLLMQLHSRVLCLSHLPTPIAAYAALAARDMVITTAAEEAEAVQATAAVAVAVHGIEASAGVVATGVVVVEEKVSTAPRSSKKAQLTSTFSALLIPGEARCGRSNHSRYRSNAREQWLRGRRIRLTQRTPPCMLIIATP